MARKRKSLLTNVLLAGVLVVGAANLIQFGSRTPDLPGGLRRPAQGEAQRSQQHQSEQKARRQSQPSAPVRTSDAVTSPAQPDEDLRPPAEIGAPRAMFVTAEVLNVRSRPDASAGVMAKLSRADQVMIVARHGAWFQARARNGAVGWLHSAFLSPQRPSLSPVRTGSAAQNRPTSREQVMRAIIADAR